MRQSRFPGARTRISYNHTRWAQRLNLRKIPYLSVGSDERARGRRQLGATATRCALFIHTYRDEGVSIEQRDWQTFSSGTGCAQARAAIGGDGDARRL